MISLVKCLIGKVFEDLEGFGNMAKVIEAIYVNGAETYNVALITFDDF